MRSAEGRNWIERLRIKLIVLYSLIALFSSLAVGLLVMPVASYLKLQSFLTLGLTFYVVFIGILWFKRIWKITPLEVANYLNAKFPVLEESAALFLKSPHELSLLEKLQVEKVSAFIPVRASLAGSLRRFWWSLVFLIIALIFTNFLPGPLQPVEALSDRDQSYNVEEEVLPEIKSVTVKITPPTYTQSPSREQKQFAIKAEVGAQVTWNIKTKGPVKKLRLIFNDREIFDLDTSGIFRMIIRQSGFYQVDLDGKKSDLYPIEVIPDLPVTLKISEPKPRTTIDIGVLPKVNLNVILIDDYGITNAYISTTLSSGKGEGVSFTEKKLSFNTNFIGKKAMRLNKMLDLTALGMKPGDELYFFIHATDNNGQTSRSDVYLISIVDPAELMSTSGMANGVDIVPEYFRSQRQIIIDTEKLLKEQSTLSSSEFDNRSNTLGMDQKLLRLRYGKFLGEEFETGAGGEHDHEEGDEHGEVAFGDVQAIMDEYAHKHDIAEDATFFEPELKAQLKAVLNEMWSSELRLRTNKPNDALPFEYKALRLLKDLQQKSRAYVAKTTLKTTKLKFEKRLTGELDKITQPNQQATFEPKDKSSEELKLLLAVLEQSTFNYGDRELLRAGEKQFIAAAARQPSSYLEALKSLRKLSSTSPVNNYDVVRVQKAIQQLLGMETLKPQLQVADPEVNLYRSYFNHLRNGN